MFRINDMITYGTEGVCRITDIVTKNLSGSDATYYVLSPVYHATSTIFVPVENQKLTDKMHPLLSKEEILAIIHAMPETEDFWVEDEPQRKEAYKALLAEGDCRKLVQIIKALYHHGQRQKELGKKLHLADERFFKEAERILCDEFAHVLEIDREGVLPFIFENIEKA